MTLLIVVREDAWCPDLVCDPKFIQCPILTPEAQTPVATRTSWLSHGSPDKWCDCQAGRGALPPPPALESDATEEQAALRACGGICKT